uniref:Uncharacterized protein n=1 Tax=Plectus sambesii TaxID=2011161 RepID=A0A914V2R3_9BILA
MGSLKAALFVLSVHILMLADAEKLDCYACEFSYWYIDYKPDSWCADKNLTDSSRTGNIRPCADEEWCFTEVRMVNDAFTSVLRGCSTKDDCNVPMCESQGFGTDIITCRNCCNSNKCNSNTSVTYYKALMATRFTSWLVPAEREEIFNNESNIHLFQ